MESSSKGHASAKPRTEGGRHRKAKQPHSKQAARGKAAKGRDKLPQYNGVLSFFGVKGNKPEKHRMNFSGS